MEQFRKVLTEAKKRFFPLCNVVGVGLGYKEKDSQKTGELAVVVFVSRKVSHRDLPKNEVIPPKIETVPTDVVEIGEVKFLAERTGKCRPARPGVSIGHYQVTAGTFGALVKDRKTGEVLILSNNHVLANASNGQDRRAAIGDNILQPGPYDGGGLEDVIGVLHRFVPIYPELRVPDCAAAKLAERVQNLVLHAVRPAYQVHFLKTETRTNLVDCALAKPLSPRLVAPEILGLGPVKGTGKMTPGLRVKKSGRTTGLTTGEIKTVATTLRIQTTANAYALFTDQAVSDLKSAGGDSGSLVLDEENRAVGLLFAGSEKFTIINQIHHVLEQLGITLVEEREGSQ